MSKIAWILILGQHHQSKPNFTKTEDPPKINSKELMGETVECVDTVSVNLQIAFECLSKICFSYKQWLGSIQV